MPFLKEPSLDTTSPPSIGILLLNLGTPDAPTPAAVRRYLAQFLSDPRVVELPRALWLPVLHGIVLRTRPAKSAAKYAAIWSKEGSPLRAGSEKQAKLLKGWLGERGFNYPIEVGMRYGQPSIASALEKIRAAGCEKLLVFPLYPQYAASTTASGMDEIFKVLQQVRNQPALRTIKAFHADPGYIKALASSVRAHWSTQGRGDYLLMSFHGAPRYTHERGDPYYQQCLQSAKLLAEELSLKPEAHGLAFQSRFGRGKWFQPATDERLQALGKAGIGKLDVICPGFVCDCLETLEEIAMEGKQTFLAAGGGEYRYIPCLNDQPDWIEALGLQVQQALQGW